MRSKTMPLTLLSILVLLIAIGVIYQQKMKNASETTPPTENAQTLTSASPGVFASPSIAPLPSPGASLTPMSSPSNSTVASAGNSAVDLTVDSNGLSKATAVLNTTQGVIKFKFYPQDAPNTVNRISQLISQGFYSGLTFHRVVPNFVIQGGDPTGTGAGGSGQKLKAEFNQRRHLEGTVAMARSSDPDSADSQFYISMGTLTHLDHSYTVFGQVIEGMDVVRKIKVGDKMLSVRIE